MKRRTRLVVLIAITLAGAWLCLALFPRGPSYQGRRISYWFNNKSQNGGVDLAAFRSMGSNAVPYLVTQVKRDDSAMVGFKWRLWLGLPGWLRSRVRQPLWPNERQERAAKILQELGPAARAAVPDLIAAYTRSFVKERGLPANTRVDWRVELGHPNISWTSGASAGRVTQRNRGRVTRISPAMGARPLYIFDFEALIAIGGEHPQLVPLILVSQRDLALRGNPDLLDHLEELRGLQGAPPLATAARASVPAVLAGLADSDPIVGTTAARLLVSIAPDHPGVMPPLLKILESFALLPDEESAKLLAPTRGLAGDGEKIFELNIFRQAVITAAGASGCEQERITFDLCRLLAFERPDLASTVKAALVRMAGKNGGSRRIVLDSLKSPEAMIRRGAAEVLGRLGPAANDALPALAELVKEPVEPDPVVRRRAAEALWQIDGRVEPLIPYRILDLEPLTGNDANPAIFLGKCGERAKAAIPSLIEMLQRNPNIWMRGRAAITLGEIGPAAGEAIPALSKALNDENSSVEEAAAEALWQIDGQVEPLIPFWIAHMPPLTGDGWKAATMLGKCGARAKVAVPPLIEMLQKNSDNRMRGKAAITLGEIGPSASEAIPALKQALGDEYRNVQEAAGEALKKISTEGKAP